jgi:hypothetical protein
MQACAPDAVDTANESEATRKLYGLDNAITEPFGRQCLMARRLVERGVRFVQLFQGGVGNANVDSWDAHADVKSNHSQHAAESDRPIAGLLTDLKARGLLDSTLVIWHGEFGRMPISQRGVGRDHNPGTMSIWMAGARIKGGQVIGSSDEWATRHRNSRFHITTACDDPALAGYGPYEAHLSIQRARHAAHRRLWHIDSANCEYVKGEPP